MTEVQKLIDDFYLERPSIARVERKETQHGIMYFFIMKEGLDWDFSDDVAGLDLAIHKINKGDSVHCMTFSDQGSAEANENFMQCVIHDD